jgi:phospholipase/carboxylesterase
MPDEWAILNMDRPVLLTGTSIDGAAAAMVMLHGRGATAQDILTNIPLFDVPDFAYLAPQANHNAWYPYPFTVPLRDNEPDLSASLEVISGVMSYITEAGISLDRIILFGFSQGACLALEYAARHARQYGGVVGLSGGLIGPDGMSRDDRGSLGGCPVFLGCSDVDPYIPKHRVEQAAETLSQLGGAVTLRLYPNMEHTINEDEISTIRDLMAAIKTQ